MKRLLPLPFLLLTALAACDRLEPVSIPGGSDKQTAGVETVSVSFEQNVNDEPGTKADVAGNGRTTWSEGDRIAYCITEADGSNPAFRTAEIDLDESAVSMFIPQGHKRAHYAIYPASAAVDGHYDAPWVEYPNAYDLTGKNPATWAPAPMVAANAGGQMKFYHVGGLLHLRIVGVYDDGIDEIAVVFLGSGDAPFRVTGHYSVSNAASASATLTAQGEGSNIITFTGLADASAFSDKTGLYELNIPVPALADYSALQQIRVDLKQGGALVHSFNYAVAGKWSKFLRARGRTAGLALHGLSIAPGKQVVMARGNLQATYDGSAWSWAFAEHQPDYIGNATANDKVNGAGTLSVASGTIDLFGWNGASSPNNCYGINNSTSYADYGNDATEGLKTDWGAIPDVVDQYGAGWRTLTRNEWIYMFNTRSGATVNGVADARYTRATIMDNPATNIGTTATDAGLHGMLLFPDDFVVPEGLSANFTWGAHINSNAKADTDELGRWNVFAKMTDDDWGLLEAAGCVFLPAAGYRSGTTVLGVGNQQGYYWSSSPYVTATTAYRVYFFSGGVYPQNGSYRLYGFSVRLARDF